MTLFLKKTGVIIVVYCTVLLCFVGGEKKKEPYNSFGIGKASKQTKNKQVTEVAIMV